MKKYDVLVIGGGIYGITAAVELALRKYNVGLINPDTIPHHMAASTDVTKAVRMEYGSDKEYFNMVEMAIEKWRSWNDFFDEKLYHEVGFLMLCKEKIENEKHTFEKHSYENLIAAGYAPDRLDAKGIRERFPAVNTLEYIDANFNRKAGYADSALTVQKLADYAKSLGVAIHEGQTASSFEIDRGRLTAVKTKEGETFQCGHALVAAGVHTPILLPELQPYMKSTGHPVFWLRPENPTNFTPPHFSVFTADISNSGWYGFPYLHKHGIVKIAKHSNGTPVHPEKDDRQITDAEVADMRSFVKTTFPELTNAPLVYTRRCLYIDTLDGHFWIDNHPDIKGLSVSTGGSGHGLKMAPLLGAMAADVIEEKSHRFSKRHRWRHLTTDTSQVEEARYVINRKL
ncbi:sarcosine oxidase [Flagellimonas aquimarina]|uniref:Sarcosine oxidase n=1 Tax=Flagellimonas aquimarina TaxID=2201895 RepID=A0A316KVT5_9FLAO|nr:FAD-dependent oxidoreductase [Allomuricauda koreensis]PWL37671.1 sarcosine oxidase [Allomuricauda koreensis]